MRLVTYQSEDGPEAAVLLGEELVPVSALGAAQRSVRGLIAELGESGLIALHEHALASAERLALAEVVLEAPVPDPQKIVCIGLNYRDHAQETGQEIPQAPMWFAKFANSLTGSGREVVLPAAHPDHVDYEAELALVIGAPARNVSPELALDARRRGDALQRRERA